MQISHISHIIHEEKDKLYIIYPLNYSELQIQSLIEELKAKLINDEDEFIDSFQHITLDTEDIAISLLFFFQKILNMKSFKDSETIIFFHPKVYASILSNFPEEEIFHSERIQKIQG